MLLQLPEELLTDIIDLLGIRDLKELARVNKVLSIHCQPSLYRHVVFTHGAHRNHQATQPLRSFVRMILYWPGRAAFVKSLRFVAHPKGSKWAPLEPLSPNEVAVLAERVPKAFYLASLVIGELATGGDRSVDAAVAFLLHALPALRSIQLGINPKPRPENLIRGPTMMITNAMFAYKLVWSQPDERLKSLETIEACGKPATYRDQDSGRLEDRVKLFLLPRIKSMTLCLTDEGVSNGRYGWASSVPRLPTLHTLNLQFSNVNLVVLEQLLEKLPNLKRFEHHFRCNVGFIRTNDLLPSDESLLACDWLRRAVQIRADTQEHLALSIGFHQHGKSTSLDDLDNYEYGISGTLGDMSSLTKLRSLKVPLVMLLGWSARNHLPSPTLDDILPTSLEQITCSDDLLEAECWDWTLEELRQKLNALRTRRPQLRIAAHLKIAGLFDRFSAMFSDLNSESASLL